MSRISLEPYFHSTNGRLNESDFRAFQNVVGEHSISGITASLYKLTKSVPDPFGQQLTTESF